MAEERYVNNTMANEAGIYKTHKIEHSESQQDTKIQKIRNFIQNIFNRSKSSTECPGNKLDDKENKHASQITNLMSQNVELSNNPHKGPLNERRNKEPLITGSGESVIELWMKECNLNEDNKQLLGRTDRKIKEKPFEKFKFEEYDFKSKSLEEIHDKRGNKTEKTDFDQVEASIENNKYSGISRKSKESIIKLGLVDPESEYANNRKSQNKEIPHRLSGCHIQQRFSNDDDCLRDKNKRFLKLDRFIENNVRSIKVPRLQSGGVTILNEEDTNAEFSEFQPDIGKIIDHTQTSRKVASNPDLLSGGEVVLEGFAEIFKLPNYYKDNPVIVDKFYNDSKIQNNDTKIHESSSLEIKSSKTFVSSKYFSGGNVTNNSSKGVTLPELFPLKQPGLDKQPASVRRHLSGGDIVKSFGSEN